MDISQIQTVDAELDVAKAIARLEQANNRLLECTAFDVAEIELAMTDRDEAVRTIAATDAACLDEPLAERLLVAFEDGRLVRQKLIALYRGFDQELKRMERLHAGDQACHAASVSAIG